MPREADAAGNTKNTTRKDGKYAKQMVCEGCRKPAGSDPYCDGDTGHVICTRKACLKRLDTMTSAERKIFYNRTEA